MLEKLSIKNYILIQDLQIEFHQGFHTLTGETGAGKSIILGALNLISGQRADTGVLLDAQKKCILEATFQLGQNWLPFFKKHDLDYDAATVIRREIIPSGKSRAFINDTPVRLDIVKKMTSRLIDIHAQHGTLGILKPEKQLALLDSFAGINDQVANYQKDFSRYRSNQKKLEHLYEKQKSQHQEIDFIQFQLTELEEAHITDAAEAEKLEQELKKLESAELIQISLNSGAQILQEQENSINDRLLDLLKDFEKIRHLDDTYAHFYERLQGVQIEVEEMARDLESEGNSVEIVPEALTQTQERLNELNRLMNKHHCRQLADLIDYEKELKEKLQDFENLDDDIAALEQQLANAFKALEKQARILSKKRQTTAPGIEQKMKQLLSRTGMPNASIKINFEPLDKLTEYGLENIYFLFTANKGLKADLLQNTASGGELSRIALCLKTLSTKDFNVPTIIFDEIDTGISGNIAEKVGLLMQQLGNNHQVLSITHLPQVAALGKHHYLVYKKEVKQKSRTFIKNLAHEERVQEIANMLGSSTAGESAIANAKALLNHASTSILDFDHGKVKS